MKTSALKSRRAMVGIGIAFIGLLLVLAFVFVRASIEAGEERFWLVVCLFTAPVLFGVLLVWSLSGLNWPARLGVGGVGLVIVAVLLVQAVGLADKVYEHPERFRPFLSTILRAESAYFAVFPAEAERHSRHKEKARRWQAVERSSSG